MSLENYYKNQYDNLGKISEQGELICPYCFGELADAWEYDLVHKNETEIECPFCFKEFKASAMIECTYETVRIEGF